MNMSMLRRSFVAVLLYCCLAAATADDAPKEFTRTSDEERYHALIEELRCVKCQNQNLADSNAPIADDIRQEIYEMIEEGRDNPAIIQFLVDRYGDFVLYRPPLKSSTWLLWFGPFVLFAGAVITLLYFIRKRPVGSTAVLTLTEKESLQKLLNGQGKIT